MVQYCVLEEISQQNSRMVEPVEGSIGILGEVVPGIYFSRSNTISWLLRERIDFVDDLITRGPYDANLAFVSLSTQIERIFGQLESARQ